jgi:Ca2+-binding EF-hand superfamily protein
MKNITGGDIDELWVTSDADKGGSLDKAECKVFLGKLKDMMAEDRAANYDETKLDEIFAKYDEDNDGFMEKFEMTGLIKKVFKKKK